MTAAPIRVEGRRLREIRIAPTTAAIGLALVVIAFVAWLVSMFVTSAPLGVLAGLCSAVATLIAGAYTWRRLTRRGRILFGLPCTLLPLALVLTFLGVPGANVVAYAGAVALIVAIGLGVIGRPAAAATFSLARASVEASLLRSEEPAEPLPVLLDHRGLHFAPGDPETTETWPTDQIATARLHEAGPHLVLRLTDRIGDEIALQVDPTDRPAAQALVTRLSTHKP